MVMGLNDSETSRQGPKLVKSFLPGHVLAQKGRKGDSEGFGFLLFLYDFELYLKNFCNFSLGNYFCKKF
jgi:hypothetical protein